MGCNTSQETKTVPGNDFNGNGDMNISDDNQSEKNGTTDTAIAVHDVKRNEILPKSENLEINNGHDDEEGKLHTFKYLINDCYCS